MLVENYFQSPTRLPSGGRVNFLTAGAFGQYPAYIPNKRHHLGRPAGAGRPRLALGAGHAVGSAAGCCCLPLHPSAAAAAAYLPAGTTLQQKALMMMVWCRAGESSRMVVKRSPGSTTVAERRVVEACCLNCPVFTVLCVTTQTIPVAHSHQVRTPQHTQGVLTAASPQHTRDIPSQLPHTRNNMCALHNRLCSTLSQVKPTPSGGGPAPSMRTSHAAQRRQSLPQHLPLSMAQLCCC